MNSYQKMRQERDELRKIIHQLDLSPNSEMEEKIKELTHQVEILKAYAVGMAAELDRQHERKETVGNHWADPGRPIHISRAGVFVHPRLLKIA